MFCKKGVLRNFAQFTENTCARVSFLIRLQAQATWKWKFVYKLSLGDVLKNCTRFPKLLHLHLHFCLNYLKIRSIFFPPRFSWTFVYILVPNFRVESSKVKLISPNFIIYIFIFACTVKNLSKLSQLFFSDFHENSYYDQSLGWRVQKY